MIAPPNNPLPPTLAPPSSGVTVRMYNPGFGDCFLLAFRAEDGLARYLLIDCGAHHQYPGRTERLRKVAYNIAQASGGHLHVVVATHEHTDHLLGFRDGRPAFDQCTVDDLWLAWTEDPADPAAKQLKDRHGLQLRALRAAAQHLALADEPLAGPLQALLDFQFTEAPVTADAQSTPLAYLRDKSMRKLQRPEDYCRPGRAPASLPGVPGVKVYVLGPPQDIAGIRTLESEGELYPELVSRTHVEVFAAAALATTDTGSLGDDDRELIRRSRPFDEAFEIPETAATTHPNHGTFFCRAYGFTDEGGHGPAWRRIETDWLAAAGQLALDLNTQTNNTSLALAIEMETPGQPQFLLFAADSQAGNWLSWHGLSWPGEGTGGTTLTVPDLLRRTVLYKVGHHGSRNATLSARGLEMMTHPDLVALLPVDQAWANHVKGWEHPAEQLLERLRARTRGRILRTDQIPAGDEPPSRPPEASEAEWQAFVERIEWDRSPDRLWVQYTVGS